MSDRSETDAGAAFTLPRAMWREIVAHAEQELPRECCGLISGKQGRAVRLYRLTNLAAGSSRYDVDPREILHLEFHELPAAGAEVLAIYHSHPVSAAYPSATDLELAFWPDAYYLICSLQDQAAPVVRAFRLTEGNVSEFSVIVLD